MRAKRLVTEQAGELLEETTVTDQELISNLHADMIKLTKAVDRLSQVIEPVAEHMPALVEVALIWNTGKAVGKTARVVAAIFKWLSGVAVSIAAVYLLFHARYGELVGLHRP